MNRRFLLLLCLVGGLFLLKFSVALRAQDSAKTDEKEPSPQALSALAETLRPSMVVVAYRLRYDKGEAPRFYGSYSSRYGELVIEEERLLEVPGFLLSKDKLITPDLIIHRRFIESIAVRCGDQTVPAEPVTYARRQSAVVLKLAEPLKAAKPLAFDKAAEGPYYAVGYQLYEGQWAVRVTSMPTTVALPSAGQAFARAPVGVVVATAQGTPVGVAMQDELPVDGSWKGSPLDWPMVSAEELTGLLARAEKISNAAVMRVALSFRSPQKRAGLQETYGGGDVGTERNVTGLLIGSKRVLLMTHLPKRVTARLERIRVYPTDGGEPVEATFAGSLKDYGCVLATLKEPVDGAVTLATGDVRARRQELLVAADVEVLGVDRVAYFVHDRISGFQRGWKANIYPEVGGYEENLFLFDTEGRLVALPVVRRLKTTLKQDWSGNPVALTAGAQMADVLNAKDLAAHLDEYNTPLPAEKESRLAWMGVELQPMSREIARIHKVTRLTRDGKTGAIVSHVYADSPAAKAGVEVGWILLRLVVQGQPKPLKVTISEYLFVTEPFPWEMLDRVAEQNYERIPPPWAPRDNRFTLPLTDLGFGVRYRAEFFVDGKELAQDFEVVESPAHFETAERFKTDAAGLTVRDMTFELLRYFRRAAEEPGVIVSTIEPGSKASVAGLKPYEIVTHVNDEPVHSVKDFEGLMKDQAEPRLSVLRMTQGRIVKLRLTDDEEGVDLFDLPEEPTPIE